MDDRADLSVNKTYSFYKKGQVIFSEGNYPQGLYCIYSGKVKIHKASNQGKEQILRLAKSGFLLGYSSLLSEDCYHASATAMEDSMICFFPKNTYQNQILGNSALSLEIMKLMSSNLKDAEQKAMSNALKHVKERIAEALLMFSDFFGLEDDNATIRNVVSRENIGNIAGTTVATTIRVLSEFNKKKLIELKGKKIKILNYNELLRLSKLSE